jgi:protein-S-isoprenylcysteine O-methyltransferase Ste14
MPLEVGEAVNSLADKFISSPFIEQVARNPIYTALLATFVIVLIIMFVFRDAETDDSLLSMCLRSGFYIFIMLAGVLLIHNKVLMHENHTVSSNSDVAGVFKNGGYSGVVTNDGQFHAPHAVEDSIVPVNVNYEYGGF